MELLHVELSILLQHCSPGPLGSDDLCIMGCMVTHAAERYFSSFAKLTDNSSTVGINTHVHMAFDGHVVSI